LKNGKAKKLDYLFFVTIYIGKLKRMRLSRMDTCKDMQEGEEKAKRTRPIGKVIIDKHLCKGCGFCVNFCPRHTLVMSKKLNDKGYHYPEVDKDNCTGCDLCGMMCPDFAIYAIKITDSHNI